MIRHIVTYILYQIENHPGTAKVLLGLLVAFMAILAAIDTLWLS